MMRSMRRELKELEQALLDDERDVVEMEARQVVVLHGQVQQRQRVIDLLQSEGFEVIVAHNAVHLLQLCVAEPPDLLLMDLALPGGVTLHLMRQVLSLQQLKQAQAFPIVLIGMNSDTASNQAALAQGAQGVVFPELQRQDLLAELRRQLGVPVTLH